MRKRLKVIAGALADSKCLIAAIANADVKHPDRLLRVGLRHKRGVRGLLEDYGKAAFGVYRPSCVTEETVLLGILLWRLGGTRAAELGYRALGLPGVTTLRQDSKAISLVPSPGFPTLSQIEANIRVVLSDGLSDVLRDTALHFILMVVEIALEKRFRYDSKTNSFLGACREHGEKTSLLFETEDDLKMLFESVDKGDVHHATEVTRL
jgi:hypothetical protein